MSVTVGAGQFVLDDHLVEVVRCTTTVSGATFHYDVVGVEASIYLVYRCSDLVSFSQLTVLATVSIVRDEAYSPGNNTFSMFTAWS